VFFVSKIKVQQILISNNGTFFVFAMPIVMHNLFQFRIGKSIWSQLIFFLKNQLPHWDVGFGAHWENLNFCVEVNCYFYGGWLLSSIALVELSVRIFQKVLFSSQIH
jgi:hypothetical protein